jgi:hypothetical protein
LATAYISQTQLTAVVPANLIASAGAARVSVTTSAGTSASATFTINPAIKITTTTLPAGTAGNAYAGVIQCHGRLSRIHMDGYRPAQQHVVFQYERKHV